MKTGIAALLAFLVISLLVSLGVMTHFILKYIKGPTYQECSLARLNNRSQSSPEEVIESSPTYRLPNNTYPIHYNVSFEPNFTGNDSNLFHYNGSVSILVKVKEDISLLVVHAGANLNYTENDIIVNEVGSNKNLRRSVTYDIDRELVKIQTWKTLTKDMEIILKFKNLFSYFNKDLRALYYTSYLDDGEIKHMATSQMQPVDARKAFPCFDEPGYKAKFKIRITRPKKYKSLANAKLLKTTDLGDGRQEDEFEDTPIMATYILAFIVTEMPYKEITFLNGKKLRVFAQPKYLDHVDFSMNATKHFFEIFEPYFDMEYPLDKLDMVAVPDFNAGAMENWGLITFKESSMLFDKEKCSATALQKMTKIVFHELGHMWFGNLVTISWWEHLWLNEGFASFIETLGIREVFPNWYDSNSLHFEIQTLYNTETNGISHPVVLNVDHPNDINRLFDDISYVKGNAIIYMCQGFLGDEKLKQFFRRYLKKFPYKNTESKDLWDTLAEVTKEIYPDVDIHDAMDAWLNETGIPLVTINYAGNNTFKFRQNRLSLLVKQNSEKDNVTWTIPLNYLTKKNPNEKPHENVKWIKKKEFELSIPFEDLDDNWLIANIERRSYYLTNYDEFLWERIINVLLTDHTKIPVENRAMLLDDCFRFVFHNVTDISIFMKLAPYLKKEKHSLPWRIAGRIFQIIQQQYMETRNLDLIQYFANDIVDPHIDSILWDYESEDNNSEKHKVDFNIGSIAASFDHPRFREKAEEKYKVWKTSNYSYTVIANSIKGPMLQAIMARSTKTEWNQLFSLFALEDSDNFKIILLHGLMVSKDFDMLRRILEETEFHSPQLRQELDHWAQKNPVLRYVKEVSFVSNMNFLVKDEKTGIEVFDKEKYTQMHQNGSLFSNLNIIYAKLREYKENHFDLGPVSDNPNMLNKTLKNYERAREYEAEVMPKMIHCLAVPKECGTYETMENLSNQPFKLRQILNEKFPNLAP